MTWKSKLKGPWGLMRTVRVVMGVIILVEAWRTQEYLFGALGIVLLWQAILNVGCCGATGCDINHTSNEPRSYKNEPEEVTFTEVTKR